MKQVIGVGRERELRALLDVLFLPIADETDAEGRSSYAAFLFGMRVFSDFWAHREDVAASGLLTRNVGGPTILLSPTRLGQTAALQEGVCDHCHQCVAMQPCPRSPLEVVETQFFLQLLVSLLAGPARLHRAGQDLEHAG